MNYIKALADAADIVEATFCELGYPDLPYDLSFNNRFTRRMGDALLKNGIGRIRLSKPLWPRASAAERFETIVHEACHIVQRHIEDSQGLLRSEPHGRLWQSLMRQCGLAPDRCHNVNRKGISRKHKRVRAFCGCKSRTITKNKETRIARGQLYRCLKCKEFISTRTTDIVTNQRRQGGCFTFVVNKKNNIRIACYTTRG